MRKNLLSCLALATLPFLNSFAAEEVLFTLEKSYNPENYIVVHTEVNDKCQFVQGPNGYMDYYWMTNGTDRTTVSSLIRSQVNKRIRFQEINERKDLFKVAFADLSMLKHDLADPIVEVRSEMVNGKCQVQSVISLGASVKYSKMDVKKTFCEVSKNFIGIPTGCKFLDLEGVDADSGTALSVRFKSN